MDHLTASASTKYICLEFSRGDTIDIEMKDIGCRSIPSRDLSNSKFPPAFYFVSNFIASTDSSACRSTSPIPYLV